MRRRLGLAVVAAIALGAAVLLLVHAPFVRAHVLRYAAASIETRYGIRLEAARLDYSLWSRRVGVAGVRVAAAGKQPPFFEADYVSVLVPGRTLLGDIFFDEVAVRNGLVRIVATAAGDNLPVSGGADTGDPTPLPIGRLALSPLRVDVRDEASGIALDVPAMTVALADDEGRIALTQPATLRVGERATRITSLAGDATFDGRTLRLIETAAALDEGQVTVAGDLTLIAREPRMDLRVSGTADVARLAQWGMAAADAPAGSAAFSGGVAGPLAAPTASFDVSVPRLTWQQMTLTNASARARLTADTLIVDSLDTEVQGGHVSGALTLPFDGALTASAIVRLENQPPPYVPIALPGESRLEVAGGAWRLDGRHRIGNAAPAVVALRGRLADDLLQSTIAGTARIGDADLAALLTALRRADLVDVPADAVPAGRVQAAARVSGTLGRPRVAFTAASDELRLPSPAASGPAAVAGTFDAGTERYTFEATLPGWRVLPTADVPLTAQADARIAGSGRAAAVTARATVAARDVAWDDVAVGAVDATVDLDPQLAHVVASAPQFNAVADARVATQAPYMTSLTARVDRLSLARILEGVETPVPLGGETSAVLRAEGPLERWRDGAADLEITALEATAGELPIHLDGPATLRYAAGRVAVDRLEADAGATRIAVTGDIAAFEPGTATVNPGTRAPEPAPANGLVAIISGDVGEAARAIAATGLTELPVAGGRGPVALLARVTGSLEAPLVAADLEVGPGEIAITGLPAITDLRLRTHVEDGWAELREAHGVYQGAVVEGTGRVPLSLFGVTVAGAQPGDASLQARATGITAAVLQPFIDPAATQEIAGSVDATLALDSPSLDPAAARGALVIDRLDVRVADLPVTQRVPTRIAFRDGFARIEAWDWTGQGATLGVQGQVRLNDLQAAILADGTIDLRMATPFVREAGLAALGTLRPRLSITGALTDPRIDGDVLIDGAELRLAEPRIVIADLNGRAVLTRSTATLPSLAGSINGGTLTATGVARLLADSGIDAQLATEIRGMALEFPEGLRSEIDASLRLVAASEAGGELPGGRVEGTVTVLRGSYREPLAVVTGLLANVQAASVAAGVDGPDALDRLALDVRLLTDEDLIVDNNYGRLQLGADLRIIGTAAAPALSGRAVLREGGQLFVGRNVYTIDAGTIDFANPTTIEPNFNLELATRAGGEDIDVVITGTPENPGVTLSSTNADLGQADLTALLVTGRTLDELGSADAALLGAQLLGNLSADVLGFAGRAIGLDTLRLGGAQTSGMLSDPVFVATELDPTSRLTFGKTFGNNVDVTFSQSLRDGDAQTWIVEYLPSRQIELRLVSNDDDLRTVGFRHDLSFGGSRRTGAPAVPRRPDVRVATVTFSGDLILPEDRLRGELALEPGDPFDFADWQRDRDRLLALYQAQGYLTARVSASRTEADAGVALAYAIVPGTRTEIAVRGAELPGAVMRELRRAWADSVFDGFLLDEASAIVRAALARDGYLQATAVAAMTRADALTTLTIDVDPGPRTRATSIRIDGADQALAAGLAPNDPAAIERVVGERLRAGGYLRARVQVGAPIVEGQAAVVPVAVTPGDAIVVGRVAFDGVARLPIGEVREAAGLPQGGPADPAAIERARERVLALYRREGFATAAVRLQQALRPDEPQLDVTFIVMEGARQVLAEVAIAGNRSIDTDLIERALRLPLDQPLRPDEWLQARSRVFDTGLFRRVDVAAEPVSAAAAAGDTLPMRMRVTVEEWPALRLRYGVQVAEQRPEENVNGRDLTPGLSADVTRRTIFGRAASIGAAAELQRRERIGRVFFSAPTMGGLPVQSSLILEQTRRDFADATLVTSTRGASWEQRVRATPRLNLSYAYRYERNHTFDTNPTDPDFVFDLRVNVARLISNGAWDTRDDPADATRGSLVSTSVELAASRLGSDIAFARSLTQAYRFQPWRGVVFASAARAGLVTPLAGQELLSLFKFFAGGARTVRGVAEDGLGERDIFGDPRGGQGLLVFNQEVRFPVYRWLRGVGFVDAGAISPEAKLAFGDLVTSAGFGIRFTTPFGVLRADYGRVLAPGPGDPQSGRWTFGIGQAF